MAETTRRANVQELRPRRHKLKRCHRHLQGDAASCEPHPEALPATCLGSVPVELVANAPASCPTLICADESDVMSTAHQSAAASGCSAPELAFELVLAPDLPAFLIVNCAFSIDVTYVIPIRLLQPACFACSQLSLLTTKLTTKLTVNGDLVGSVDGARSY